MEKLTKKQRHEIYKKALPLIQEHHWACYAIEKVMGLKTGSLEAHVDKIFPELWSFRNESACKTIFLDCVDFNWQDGSGQAFRELVLMFCIEMTR
jgi:hypothetical protein